MFGFDIFFFVDSADHLSFLVGHQAENLIYSGSPATKAPKGLNLVSAASKYSTRN